MATKTATKKAPAKAAKPKTSTKRAAKASTAEVVDKPVKKTPVYPTSIADKKAWQKGAKLNKKTGFTEGTISDKIAMALLKGGKSRADIVNSMPDLPTETRKGTKFQAANVAATVERQLKAMGFQVVQSYKVVPPKRSSTN